MLLHFEIEVLNCIISSISYYAVITDYCRLRWVMWIDKLHFFSDFSEKASGYAGVSATSSVMCGQGDYVVLLKLVAS